MISFGSYNPPNKNCVKDVLQVWSPIWIMEIKMVIGQFPREILTRALLLSDHTWHIQLSLCNALTAIYGCAVIFAILGFKAQTIFDKCMNQWVPKTTKLLHLVLSNNHIFLSNWKARAQQSDNFYLRISVMCHWFWVRLICGRVEVCLRSLQSSTRDWWLQTSSMRPIMRLKTAVSPG